MFKKLPLLLLLTLLLVLTISITYTPKKAEPTPEAMAGKAASGPSTIYSVSDGYWDMPSVWSEERVPNENDTVEIRHDIDINGVDPHIAGLSINPGARLQNARYFNITLSIARDLENNGLIQSHPDYGWLKINMDGRLLEYESPKNNSAPGKDRQTAPDTQIRALMNSAPTIHSVGGYNNWSATSTWVEGRLPLPGDIVEINGTVNFNIPSAAIAGLAVSEDAILQGQYNTILIIDGDAVNDGIIRDYSSNPHAFFVEISGNIENNGVWANYQTVLFRNFSREFTGANPISGTIVMGDSFALSGNSAIGGDLLLNYQSLTVNAPYMFTGEDARGRGYILGSGTVEFTGTVESEDLSVAVPEISLYSFGGMIDARDIILTAYLYNSVVNADQVTIDGSLRVNGSTVDSPLIVSASSRLLPLLPDSTMFVNGQLVNNGTIGDISMNRLDIYASGDITNKGSWENRTTYLASGPERVISDPDLLIRGRFVLDDDIALADDSALGGTLDLNGHALTVKASHSLLLGAGQGDGSFLGGGRIEFRSLASSRITADDNHIVLAGNFGDIVLGAAQAIISGPVHTSGGIINAPLTVAPDASLLSYSGLDSDLVINGDLSNNGIIADYGTGGHLTLYVSGDIANDGNWHSREAYVFWPHETADYSYEWAITQDKNNWPNPIAVAPNHISIKPYLTDTWYWRYRAVYADGIVGEWSGARGINAAAELPAEITVEVYKMDGQTLLNSGDQTTGNTVVFKGQVSDFEGQSFRLEYELATPDSGYGDYDLSFVTDYVGMDEEATLTTTELPNGEYHFRVRAVNDQSQVSEWQEHGSASGYYFKIKTVPLYTQNESPYPSEIETGFWAIEQFGYGGTGGFARYTLNLDTAGDYTIVTNGEDDEAADNTRAALTVGLYQLNANRGYGQTNNVSWPSGDNQYKNVQTVFENVPAGIYTLKLTSNHDYVDINNPTTDAGNLNVYLDWFEVVGPNGDVIRIEAEDKNYISKLKGGYIDGDKLIIDGYACGRTIATCACAATSMLMVGRYYDINTGIDGTDSNPFNLNDWLRNNAGYDQDGIINWPVAGKYLSRRDADQREMAWTPEWPIHAPMANIALINSYIDDMTPVITWNNSNGHFFVMDDRIKYEKGETYTLKDPYWYQTKTLDEEGDGVRQISDYLYDYDNKFTSARLFQVIEKTVVLSGSLAVKLSSPAVMLVIDPQGRKYGYDPVNDIHYDEIPGARYFEDPRVLTSDELVSEEDIHYTKIIFIEDALDGEYRTQVIGTGSGHYTLEFLAYNDDMEDIVSGFEYGYVEPGVVEEYGLEFNEENIGEIEMEIMDETPPEANIYIDPENKTLTVEGTDNITQNLTVTEKKICSWKLWHKCLDYDYLYTITDEAGNTLKLWVDKKEQKVYGRSMWDRWFWWRHKKQDPEYKLMAEIKKIQYNEDRKIKVNATITGHWKPGVKEYQQKIKKFWIFDINASYQNRTDQTRIWGYDRMSHAKVNETKQGLTILKLNTNEGNITYEY